MAEYGPVQQMERRQRVSAEVPYTVPPMSAIRRAAGAKPLDLLRALTSDSVREACLDWIRAVAPAGATPGSAVEADGLAWLLSKRKTILEDAFDELDSLRSEAASRSYEVQKAVDYLNSVVPLARRLF